MKKLLFVIIIIVLSIGCFYFGCLFQKWKTDNMIMSLNGEISQFKEQISRLQQNNQNFEEEINNLNNAQIQEQNTQKSKNEYKHPIDIAEEKCIATSHVYDYPLCTERAEKAWDKEIQKNLNLLKKEMSDDEYKQIIEMNKTWEKSVYNEISVINRFISDKDGIIYQTGGSNDITQLKKQYALLLKSIYSNYYEEKHGMF